MAKPLWYMLGGNIVMGVFTAIFIMTGINIEPIDLITSVFRQMFQTINNPQATSFWGTISGIIVIISILQVATDIVSYILFGWQGIIVALCGFLGMLLFFLGGGGAGTYVGLIFLLAGFIICYIFEGTAPKDFMSRNI